MPELLREQIDTRSGPASELAGSAGGRIVTHSITALDISATHIRDTLHSGRSPRYLLPDTVLDHIHTHQLYQANHA